MAVPPPHRRPCSAWPWAPDVGLLAHVSGLLADYLAPVMMLLMARTPVLEQRVGPDVLARWHSMGRMFLALVLVHAGAAAASWAAARGHFSSASDSRRPTHPNDRAATAGRVGTRQLISSL